MVRLVPNHDSLFKVFDIDKCKTEKRKPARILLVVTCGPYETALKFIRLLHTTIILLGEPKDSHPQTCCGCESLYTSSHNTRKSTTKPVVNQMQAFSGYLPFPHAHPFILSPPLLFPFSSNGRVEKKRQVAANTHVYPPCYRPSVRPSTPFVRMCSTQRDATQSKAKPGLASSESLLEHLSSKRAVPAEYDRRLAIRGLCACLYVCLLRVRVLESSSCNEERRRFACEIRVLYNEQMAAANKIDRLDVLIKCRRSRRVHLACR